MDILVRFFPNEITEDEILELVEPFGTVTGVQINTSEFPDRASVLVSMDVSRTEADRIAERLRGLPWRDRTLDAQTMLRS